MPDSDTIFFPARSSAPRSSARGRRRQAKGPPREGPAARRERSERRGRHAARYRESPGASLGSRGQQSQPSRPRATGRGAPRRAKARRGGGPPPGITKGGAAPPLLSVLPRLSFSPFPSASHSDLQESGSIDFFCSPQTIGRLSIIDGQSPDCCSCLKVCSYFT